MGDDRNFNGGIWDKKTSEGAGFRKPRFFFGLLGNLRIIFGVHANYTANLRNIFGISMVCWGSSGDFGSSRIIFGEYSDFGQSSRTLQSL